MQDSGVPRRKNRIEILFVCFVEFLVVGLAIKL